MVHFDAIALGITAIELIVMAVVTTINVRYYVTLIFRNVQIIIVFRVILTQDLCSVYTFVYIYIYIIYIYIYTYVTLSYTLFLSLSLLHQGKILRPSLCKSTSTCHCMVCMVNKYIYCIHIIIYIYIF